MATVCSMPDPVKHLIIRIRVDPTQKADFEWAARRQGSYELSTWLRSLATREVEELKRRGKRRVER